MLEKLRMALAIFDEIQSDNPAINEHLIAAEQHLRRALREAKR